MQSEPLKNENQEIIGSKYTVKVQVNLNQLEPKKLCKH